MKSVQAAINKGFTLSDGPCVQGLDNAFNVHRQQYYVGIFISTKLFRYTKFNATRFQHNRRIVFLWVHTHTYLYTAIKLGNPMQVVHFHLALLLQDATEMHSRFHPVLSRFAKCHFIYNKKIVDKENATELGMYTIVHA